jgi:hypothetical protein
VSMTRIRARSAGTLSAPATSMPSESTVSAWLSSPPSSSMAPSSRVRPARRDLSAGRCPSARCSQSRPSRSSPRTSQKLPSSRASRGPVGLAADSDHSRAARKLSYSRDRTAGYAGHRQSTLNGRRLANSCLERAGGGDRGHQTLQTLPAAVAWALSPRIAESPAAGQIWRPISGQGPWLSPGSS